MSADFKKKQKANIPKKIAFIFCGFLILFAIVFLVSANIRTYQKKKELNAQMESLKNKIAEIKNKNDSLQQGISQSSDQKYIEKVAREELDLQKPGEKVVSFITPVSQTQNNNPTPKSFLQNWPAWVSKLFNNSK